MFINNPINSLWVIWRPLYSLRRWSHLWLLERTVQLNKARTFIQFVLLFLNLSLWLHHQSLSLSLSLSVSVSLSLLWTRFNLKTKSGRWRQENLQYTLTAVAVLHSVFLSLSDEVTTYTFFTSFVSRGQKNNWVLCRETRPVGHIHTPAGSSMSEGGKVFE